MIPHFTHLQISKHQHSLRGSFLHHCNHYFPESLSCFCLVEWSKVDTNLKPNFVRWVKFEEDVEEGGNRWSKPHVGTLSLHSLFELRSLILNGTIMLDMEATSLEHIADLLLDNLINSGAITYDKREQVWREAPANAQMGFEWLKEGEEGG